MTGQMMAVQIPAGMTAGQQMIIQAPNGMKMQIVVPPGVSPGQTIHVQVPEAAPAATKLSAAQMVLSRKALDIVMKKLAAEMIFSITRPQAEEAINELLQSESKELTAAGVGAFANRAFNVLKAKQAKLARGDPPAVRQPLQALDGGEGTTEEEELEKFRAGGEEEQRRAKSAHRLRTEARLPEDFDCQEKLPHTSHTNSKS